MRLQFQLDKIKIDPVCHVQLVRHAEEFQGRNNIYGQLYGALLDNTAQVTSVLPLPEGQKTTKEELEAMERRNDDLLGDFNLDQEKIGWYLICYTRNFWDNLQTMKYYENYINTSFFLIYDYKARIEGKNPYKAFRLKDQFALKENFKWSDLQKSDFQKDNPLEEIPVEVQKNQIFELMMLWNRDKFLKGFESIKRETPAHVTIKKNIEEYMATFEVREQIQKEFNDNYRKLSQTPDKQQQKMIPFEDYCQFLGQAFKMDNYETYFKNYFKDNKTYEQLFEVQHQ